MSIEKYFNITNCFRTHKLFDVRSRDTSEVCRLSRRTLKYVCPPTVLSAPYIWICGLKWYKFYLGCGATLIRMVNVFRNASRYASRYIVGGFKEGTPPPVIRLSLTINRSINQSIQLKMYIIVSSRVLYDMFPGAFDQPRGGKGISCS